MLALAELKERIAAACHRAGRSVAEVCLIGASKQQPVEQIAALARAGLRDFGENYWQELKAKRAALAALDPTLAANLRWHFIGTLQRRKVRALVSEDILIHSLDQAELIAELEARAVAVGRRVPVLIQINTGQERTKGGIPSEALTPFLEQCAHAPHLTVLGLMALPPYAEDPEQTRPHFRLLRELRDEMNRRPVYKEPLRELSMGMSHDFEVAIEEGAAMVRIGTALFGERG